jgi:hypothetical protein
MFQEKKKKQTICVIDPIFFKKIILNNEIKKNDKKMNINPR